MEINLEAYLDSAPPTRAGPDDPPPPAPARTEFRVTLVPRLRELDQGLPMLSLQLDRSDVPFQGEASKNQALVRLLRRLQAARHSESGRRVQAWESQYAAQPERRGPRDYSLVSLLTSAQPALEDPLACAPGVTGGEGGGTGPDRENTPAASNGAAGGESGPESALRPSGLVERLVAADVSSGRGGGGGGGVAGRLAAAPLRAQAELLARLRPVSRADGELVMAAGTLPTSIFFIRSGSVAVTMGGEEVASTPGPASAVTGGRLPCMRRGGRERGGGEGLG